MRNYSHKFCPERLGKVVYCQTDDQRVFGRLVLNALAKKFSAPSYSFSSRSGGHLALLGRHVCYEWHAVVDIQNFFPSIGRNRVKRSLKKLGFGWRRAEEIALASCVNEPSSSKAFLPIGFVQSPKLAEIVFALSAAGQAVEEIDSKNELVASVYVDDILISGSCESQLREACRALCNAMAISGFSVNQNKLQISQKSISVFNVELSRGSVQLSDSRKLAFCDKLSTSDSSDVARGIKAYINNLERLGGQTITIEN